VASNADRRWATGATGAIGLGLVPMLVADGHRSRE
jgi:hypothetical protein